MEIKTYKIFSYCEDLSEKQQEYFDEISCDVFVEYTIEENDDKLEINSTLISKGAKIGETVLIHIDY